MRVQFFPQFLNSISQLIMHFFKKAKTKNNSKKRKLIASEQKIKKFVRAEWVIYLDVRRIGIKIAFYRMSSPVLLLL